jgi:hypothetical protein
MRLVSFGPRGSELPGVLVGDHVLPLAPVMASLGLPPGGTTRSVLPFLGQLPEAVSAAATPGELIPLPRPASAPRSPTPRICSPAAGTTSPTFPNPVWPCRRPPRCR